jgi:DNA-binding NarL/FixJ family response regulator
VEEVRVLVVDDREPFRRAAAEVIRLTDPFVLVGWVCSGEECLAVLPDLGPDLVVLDVGLPGMDGVETARRLSSLPGRPAVMLVSTYDESEFGGQVAECGALAYVPKAAFGPATLSAVWALRGTGITTPTSSPVPEKPSSR